MTPPARPVAVVTGAAGGLGRAIATALHADGWSVLLTDLDPTAVAARRGAARRLVGGPGRPRRGRLRRRRRDAAGRGELGLWVNNAGILVTGPSWEHDAATRRRVIDVNALGAMNGTLAALAVMRGQGHGHVLNVVSLAGLVAAPGETVYAASKHALLAFSLGTLSDLRMAGYRRVHVSCLCPDGIWTPMLHDRLDDPGAVASFTGSMLTAQQVAARAVRLARRPRPVVSLPRWRGAQVRLLDALPGAGRRADPARSWPPAAPVSAANAAESRRRTGADHRWPAC